MIQILDQGIDIQLNNHKT